MLWSAEEDRHMGIGTSMDYSSLYRKFCWFSCIASCMEAMIYFKWRERNRRTFGEKEESVNQMFDYIREVIYIRFAGVKKAAVNNTLKVN
ncbi:hypothetical protein PTKIN_Ptkin16aG0053000 [Pterospermum kingtungense]